MAQPKRRVLSGVLAFVFVFALVMGPGPGMLLINRPEPFLGIPLLYAWGLLWYAVEVAVVITAYFCLWTDEERDGNPPPAHQQPSTHQQASTHQQSPEN